MKARGTQGACSWSDQMAMSVNAFSIRFSILAWEPLLSKDVREEKDDKRLVAYLVQQDSLFFLGNEICYIECAWWETFDSGLFKRRRRHGC